MIIDVRPFVSLKDRFVWPDLGDDLSCVVVVDERLGDTVDARTDELQPQKGRHVRHFYTYSGKRLRNKHSYTRRLVHDFIRVIWQ